MTATGVPATLRGRIAISATSFGKVVPSPGAPARHYRASRGFLRVTTA